MKKLGAGALAGRSAADAFLDIAAINFLLAAAVNIAAGSTIEGTAASYNAAARTRWKLSATAHVAGTHLSALGALFYLSDSAPSFLTAAPATTLARPRDLAYEFAKLAIDEHTLSPVLTRKQTGNIFENTTLQRTRDTYAGLEDGLSAYSKTEDFAFISSNLGGDTALVNGVLVITSWPTHAGPSVVFNTKGLSQTHAVLFPGYVAALGGSLEAAAAAIGVPVPAGIHTTTELLDAATASDYAVGHGDVGAPTRAACKTFIAETFRRGPMTFDWVGAHHGSILGPTGSPPTLAATAAAGAVTARSIVAARLAIHMIVVLGITNGEAVLDAFSDGATIGEGDAAVDVLTVDATAVIRGQLRDLVGAATARGDNLKRLAATLVVLQPRCGASRQDEASALLIFTGLRHPSAAYVEAGRRFLVSQQSAAIYWAVSRVDSWLFPHAFPAFLRGEAVAAPSEGPMGHEFMDGRDPDLVKTSWFVKHCRKWMSSNGGGCEGGRRRALSMRDVSSCTPQGARRKRPPTECTARPSRSSASRTPHSGRSWGSGSP